MGNGDSFKLGGVGTTTPEPGLRTMYPVIPVGFLAFSVTVPVKGGSEVRSTGFSGRFSSSGGVSFQSGSGVKSGGLRSTGGLVSNGGMLPKPFLGGVPGNSLTGGNSGVGVSILPRLGLSFNEGSDFEGSSPNNPVTGGVSPCVSGSKSSSRLLAFKNSNMAASACEAGAAIGPTLRQSR